MSQESQELARAKAHIHSDAGFARAVVNSGGSNLDRLYDLTFLEKETAVREARLALARHPSPKREKHDRNVVGGFEVNAPAASSPKTTYVYAEHGFEFDLPPDWSAAGDVGQLLGPAPGLSADADLVFTRGPGEILNFVIEEMPPKVPASFAEQLALVHIRMMGSTEIKTGRIRVAGKKHACVRYQIPGGVWSKKYMIVLGRKGYAVTAATRDESAFPARERAWDEIVVSIRRLATETGDLGTIIDKIAALTKPADMEERIALCAQALGMVSRDGDETLWATLQLELGSSLIQNLRGDRAENIERAIFHSNQALEVFTRQTHPVEWAGVLNNLVAAYRQRIRGSRAENIEQSITYSQQALEVRTRQEYPLRWAISHNNLANAYRDRIKGDRSENVEKTIHHCQEALKVFTDQDQPWHWATAMNNLANAYQDRQEGDEAENLEQALNLYRQTLSVFTRKLYRSDWAWVHANLGTVLHRRIQSDRAKNLEEAISESELALQVFTRQAFPEKWAITHLNLGNIYRDRMEGDTAENLRQAARHYDLAGQVLTRESFPIHRVKIEAGLAAIERAHPESSPSSPEPEETIRMAARILEVTNRKSQPKAWCQAQINMGEAYRRRASGDPAQNVERAIFHYSQALEVCSQYRYPGLWAAANNNLAIAYACRQQGDPAKNIEQAFDHALKALKIYKRETSPKDWAMAQNNLAEAYRKRHRGRKAANIKAALLHYNQALQVYTFETYREEWAGVHNNLSLLYGEHPGAGQGANGDQVIAHCEAALRVYTRETYPEDWAMVHNRLAYRYLEIGAGGETEGFSQALHHGELALQVYDRRAHPEQWATTQYALALAYSGRAQGTSLENAEQAIDHAEQALAVITPAAHPVQWAMIDDFVVHAREYRRDVLEKMAPDGPGLAYPEYYEGEVSRQSGERQKLLLVESMVLDSPFVNMLILVYRWEDGLSDEAVTRLFKRAIMYTACAIYDAALAGGLTCQVSPIPNGQRPAWIIPGERSPVSLTLSENEPSERSFRLTVGAMITQVNVAPSEKALWEKLQAGFESRFSEITV